MRLSSQRKLRKHLRSLRHQPANHNLFRLIERSDRAGIPIADALRKIISDQPLGWYTRGIAARVLAIAEGAAVSAFLLKLFFSQTEAIALWETALTIEWFGDVRSVKPLASAINDDNLYRRHAAVRALGWIPDAGRLAVKALIRVLTDASQPVFVRAEAAESLAYLHVRGATPHLIAALADPEPAIRFWAVFALGSIRNHKTGQHEDRSVIPALESVLLDNGTMPGSYWSVGREALAMLGRLDPPEPRYRDQLAMEIQRVLADPNASIDDRRWAEGYGT